MLFSSTLQNKNVMVGGTGQASVVKSKKSNCTLTNKVIMWISLAADISAGLKGSPLHHQRSFPSSNCIKLNNPVSEKEDPQVRGSMCVSSQLQGVPGAKGQGMPVIPVAQLGEEEALLEMTKFMSHQPFVGPACVLQVHLFSFLTKPDPYKSHYKSTPA